MYFQNALWRRALSAFLLCVALALASGYAPVAAQQPFPVIRFGAVADDNLLPILYASAKGIYPRYGLNVQLTKFTNSAAATAAMIGGSLDMSKNSALGLINAVVKGVPLTAIGSIGYYDANKPDYALLVYAPSPVQNAQELEGKTLGAISLQDMMSISTYGWLQQRGVDPSKVQFVEIPAVATLAAMEQGRISGATMTEPYLSAAMASGKVRVLGYPFSSMAPKFAASVLFTTTAWAQAHPDLVTKFLRATQEADDYVGAHESDPVLRDLIAQYTGVDPASIADRRHPGRGVFLTPAELQPVIDFAAKYKVIPKAFPARDVICTCALQH